MAFVRETTEAAETGQAHRRESEAAAADAGRSDGLSAEPVYLDELSYPQLPILDLFGVTFADE